MANWLYDPDRRQYRRASTGAVLSPAALREAVADFRRVQEREVERLSARLLDGSLSAAGFEAEMQALITTTFTTLAVLGRGGIASMTPQDVGPIQAAIQHQYDYLSEFKGDIERGDVSPRAVPPRARMYLGAASQAFERGRAAAWGIDLPAYPGDDNQICGSNCRCEWRLEEGEETVRATWELGADDTHNCSSCTDNARVWAPLTLAKR